MALTGIPLREKIAKRISTLLIQNYQQICDVLGFDPDITTHQKTISGGTTTTGVSDTDTLLIYGNELQATLAAMQEVENIAVAMETDNLDDTAYYIVLNTSTYTSIDYSGATSLSIDLTAFDMDNLNIGQYINIELTQDSIDLDKAREILDIGLNELIPNIKTIEERVQIFFTEWDLLKGSQPDFDGDNDDGFVAPEFSSTDYAATHDHTQLSNPFGGYIVRLDDGSGRTLEDLRNELDEYLKDIDEAGVPELDDTRPKYENLSSGYIKLRSLNQGIIIRKQEGTDTGIEEIVIDSDGNKGPSYLVNGLTITMWVKFLDKVNTGTLFNYGNPIRQVDPHGFKLETFVIDKDELMDDDETTWGSYTSGFTNNPFATDNKARFVRLVLYDHLNDKTYDSHFGTVDQNRVVTTGQLGEKIPEFGNTKEGLMVNYTQIPVDFDEWYYIVATYNPDTTETIQNVTNKLYWLGYMAANGSSYVSSPSGLGSKCKVEVISKSELLRARGYAPE